MESLIIRKASIHDLDILRCFEQGVIETERAFDPTLKRESTLYYDLKKLITSSDAELVVAEIEGEVIGSGYARIKESKEYLVHKKHSYLGFMYVTPAHRKKGVNQKIMEALKQWTISKNVTEIRLEVYYSNEAAIIAYEKAGFVKHMVEMRMDLKG